MNKAPNNVDWIGVDWGTSSLRVWGLDGKGNVSASAKSKAGMSHLNQNQFEGELLQLINPWLRADRVTPVICCGMVGAKGGWAEAGYSACPCPPVGGEQVLPISTNDPRIKVHIIAGVSQANPPDVMRGEETQIAGLLRQFPDFSGTVCLPGTHSKWIQMSAGQIKSFTSFITGELFAVLTDHSLLRHSVGKIGWDEVEFLSGVDQAMADPTAISAHLFTLRARALLHDFPPTAARSALSGLLIGMELVATKSLWSNQIVNLIGENELSKKYQTAFSQFGGQTKLYNAQEMVLEGLSHIQGILDRTHKIGS